jgi:hypothetical protein
MGSIRAPGPHGSEWRHRLSLDVILGCLERFLQETCAFREIVKCYEMLVRFLGFCFPWLLICL